MHYFIQLIDTRASHGKWHNILSRDDGDFGFTSFHTQTINSHSILITSEWVMAVILYSPILDSAILILWRHYSFIDIHSIWNRLTQFVWINWVSVFQVLGMLIKGWCLHRIQYGWIQDGEIQDGCPVKTPLSSICTILVSIQKHVGQLYMYFLDEMLFSLHSSPGLISVEAFN